LIDFSQFNTPLVYHINLSEVTVYANSNIDASSSYINITSIAQLIYLSISGFLLIKFLIQLATIYQFKRNAQQIHSPIDHELIYTMSSESFSFFHLIFIKETDKENTAIYLHEKQHVKYWHSADIVLSKLLQIVFWFNPFVFLVEKELRLQHEYAVDASVLERGTKKADYQQLLLNQLFKTEFNLITNNFNQTFLKNRFIMMTKKENKKVSKFILLAFLSLVIITPFTISCSMDSNNSAKPENEIIKPDMPVTTAEPKKPTEALVDSSNQVKSKLFLVVEEMPKFLGGEKAMYKYIAENIKYPEKAKKDGIEGRVFVSFIVEKDGSVSEVELLRGIGSGCDEAALDVIRNMPQWNPGKQHGQPVRVQYRMPVKFSL
jgi:TonB family protein